MKGSINRTQNTRLGVKLAAGGTGWALILRERPRRVSTKNGDPLDLARAAAIAWNAREDGPFTMWSYLNDDAFAQSIAARDGMTREAHIVQVNRIAAQLAGEGFHVTICEVE
ncbi:hypothetical protein DFR49_3341 [Hephaestia caeni]|uniref:Uncharacterized protein n=1 Tax=Hephaestia caeni TaxID=645617 RepID=A0A397NIU3_9SPHN|nr:hypothetical protein [Hephaestia caeni]RIA37456.1 hypothetical protein DFR49_3341 [Hephaestia caeni]